jgi:2-octaprenyl-6-methoxyphenol hydroxylase
VRRDYGQHAVLTTAHAALPRRGWAWERFTAEGPLALLPHPQTPDAYSVVWCSAPGRAAELAALDNAAFSQALSAAFGDRLGRLSSQAPRHVFPLALSARRAQVHGRVAAIGNAAQTLHPVAGQGLNLGLRDAARLAQTLGGWLDHPSANPAPALAEFARARYADRAITAGLTDLMPRVFSTGLAPVEHACGLALLALDLASPLRAPLAQHLLQGFRA